MKGIRVLDCSRLLPGPLCGHLLTRLGAVVVKVDCPQVGDYVRHVPPLLSLPDNNRHGALFEALNCGKLGLGMDLKHKDAAKILCRLVPHYDVLVEGNRPGVMDRLGIGYEELSKHNPKLVFCSISGYGSSGPYAKRAGHDINYMALSGLLGVSSNPANSVLGFQAADAGAASFS